MTPTNLNSFLKNELASCYNHIPSDLLENDPDYARKASTSFRQIADVLAGKMPVTDISFEHVSRLLFSLCILFGKKPHHQHADATKKIIEMMGCQIDESMLEKDVKAFLYSILQGQQDEDDLVLAFANAMRSNCDSKNPGVGIWIRPTTVSESTLR